MIPVAGFLIGYGAVALVKSGKLDKHLFALRAWSARRRTSTATRNTLLDFAEYQRWLDTLPLTDPHRGGESV